MSQIACSECEEPIKPAQLPVVKQQADVPEAASVPAASPQPVQAQPLQKEYQPAVPISGLSVDEESNDTVALRMSSHDRVAAQKDEPQVVIGGVPARRTLGPADSIHTSLAAIQVLPLVAYALYQTGVEVALKAEEVELFRRRWPVHCSRTMWRGAQILESGPSSAWQDARS
eukprot:1943884-Amphidinium_carterae.1